MLDVESDEEITNGRSNLVHHVKYLWADNPDIQKYRDIKIRNRLNRELNLPLETMFCFCDPEYDTETDSDSESVVETYELVNKSTSTTEDLATRDEDDKVSTGDEMSRDEVNETMDLAWWRSRYLWSENPRIMNRKKRYRDENKVVIRKTKQEEVRGESAENEFSDEESISSNSVSSGSDWSGSDDDDTPPDKSAKRFKSDSDSGVETPTAEVQKN